MIRQVQPLSLQGLTACPMSSMNFAPAAGVASDQASELRAPVWTFGLFRRGPSGFFLGFGGFSSLSADRMLNSATRCRFASSMILRPFAKSMYRRAVRGEMPQDSHARRAGSAPRLQEAYRRPLECADRGPLTGAVEGRAKGSRVDARPFTGRTVVLPCRWTSVRQGSICFPRLGLA